MGGVPVFGLVVLGGVPVFGLVVLGGVPGLLSPIHSSKLFIPKLGDNLARFDLLFQSLPCLKMNTLLLVKLTHVIVFEIRIDSCT